LRRFNSLGRDGFLAILAEPAAALTGNRDIRVRLHRFGSARAALTHMREAPIPAAKQALDAAGTSVKRNDVLFSQQTGFPLEKDEQFRLLAHLGNPQAPMGTRGGIELIEELVQRGGGCSLFIGCAAGDTAIAVVIEVADRRKS
jgi:hypothetical protein